MAECSANGNDNGRRTGRPKRALTHRFIAKIWRTCGSSIPPTWATTGDLASFSDHLEFVGNDANQPVPPSDAVRSLI